MLGRAQPAVGTHATEGYMPLDARGREDTVVRAQRVSRRAHDHEDVPPGRFHIVARRLERLARGERLDQVREVDSEGARRWGDELAVGGAPSLTMKTKGDKAGGAAASARDAGRGPVEPELVRLFGSPVELALCGRHKRGTPVAKLVTVHHEGQYLRKTNYRQQ